MYRDASAKIDLSNGGLGGGSGASHRPDGKDHLCGHSYMVELHCFRPCSLRSRLLGVHEKAPATSSQGLHTGRGERTRTSDFYVPNVALYRTELHPVAHFGAANIEASAIRLKGSGRADVNIGRRFPYSCPGIAPEQERR